MSTPYVGEIRLFTFQQAPRDWALCNGQLLPINQNQALFSLLGTTYGGNGQTTFALPNLRGRAPMHFGQGPGLSDRTLGEAGGSEVHTLTQAQMPVHSHPLAVVNRPGTARSPANAYLAAHRGGYAASGNTALNPGVVSNAGGSQAHANMPPFLTLSYCICLFGIFPSPP